MEENQNQPIARTTLLTVLAVLSFIGGGLAILSNALLYFFNDEINTLLESGAVRGFPGMDMNIDLVLSLNKSFFLMQALANVLSVFGVYLMWNLKKEGFHFYTVAQIILLIIPKLYISGLPFPWFEMSLSFLFVYLYAKALRFF